MKITTFIAIAVACLLLFLPYTTESHDAPQEPVRPTLKEYARDRVLDTFGSGWSEFETIVGKESRQWTVFTAHYPKSKKSSAHGLCGFLNQTWFDTGFEKTDDPYVQVDACIEYVKKRYGNPQKALAFHLTERKVL